MSLTCARAFSLLMDFLDASLPAEMQQRMQAHMRDCTACARMRRTFEQTKTLCHDVLHKDLPEGAGERLLTALRNKLNPRP